MKKTIFCFIAIIVMLSAYATAPQVGPPLCSYAGGICETDAEVSGVCNDENMMLYGETSDCYEPGKLCCVPETCRDFWGFCDNNCDSDYVRVAEGKCGGEDVCCRAEQISGPDADGNLVCRGSSMQTKYNPKKIIELYGKEVFRTGDIGEDINFRIQCNDDGTISVYTDADPALCMYGDWVDGGKMYGGITVDPARKTLKIENGGLAPYDLCSEVEYPHNIPKEFSITADTITLSFANSEKPIVKVSGDGAIKWGDVFFGCQKKDSNGRAVSCSLSAGMKYVESEADRVNWAGNKMLSLDYVNVEGLGFISELDGLQTYLNVQPDTIEEMKEQARRDFVAMPVSNLKSIKLFNPSAANRNYPYVIRVNTAPDGSSTFNYLKIKSSSENKVNIQGIGGRMGMQPLTEEIEITPELSNRDATLDITADERMVSAEKQSAFSVDALCADAGDSSTVKINVFIGSSKLLEAVECNHIAIIPPMPENTASQIASMNSVIILSPESKKIKVIRDVHDYGDMSIWMLPGYEHFVLENPPGTGTICNAIPNVFSITNPRNNNVLEIGDVITEIKPEGRMPADLGFSFSAELCDNEKEIMETLACERTGECTLDGTRVFGIGAAPMGEVREAQATGRRFEQAQEWRNAEANSDIKTRVSKAIKTIGGRNADTPGIGAPVNCGDWLARVYKWSGYAYRYINPHGRYESLNELALAYGYPIGYNDDSGTKGHALLLLGFGSEANWWLEKFPDIPVLSEERNVNDEQALVISFYDPEVKFGIYPAGRYPHEIIRVHPWTPLCEGEYVPDTGEDYGTRYEGQYYWNNDQDGNKGVNPWSRFWEPEDSPYYPSEGDCPSAEGLQDIAEEDMPCISEGGVCADTRDMKCFENDAHTTEISFVSRKCNSNPAGWYKCCPSGFVAAEETRGTFSGAWGWLKGLFS